MPWTDGISFPRTRLERVLDRLYHWLTVPAIPATPESDWDPTLAEILVTTLDD